MQITTAMNQEVATAWANDPVPWGSTTSKVNVHLAKNSFTPGPGLTLASLTEADFPNYDALSPNDAKPVVTVDPNNQDALLRLLDPTGGWAWTCDDTISPNQTIYGYYVTNAADSVLVGAETFDEPVVISGPAQAVVIGSIICRLPNGSIT